MKNLALAALTTALLASSAAAGGISFSLPSLTFPPVPETTVSKDCQSLNATESTCTGQE